MTEQQTEETPVKRLAKMLSIAMHNGAKQLSGQSWEEWSKKMPDLVASFLSSRYPALPPIHVIHLAVKHTKLGAMQMSVDFDGLAAELVGLVTLPPCVSCGFWEAETATDGRCQLLRLDTKADFGCRRHAPAEIHARLKAALDDANRGDRGPAPQQNGVSKPPPPPPPPKPKKKARAKPKRGKR